jgi:hypothetical protein
MKPEAKDYFDRRGEKLRGRTTNWVKVKAPHGRHIGQE